MSQDCVLVEALIGKNYVLVETLVVYDITPSSSGIDDLCQSSHVNHVLVETLIDELLVFVLTLIANEITPSGSDVNSSRQSSPVNRVPVETFNSQENLSCTWIDTCSRNRYGVGYLLHPDV